MAHRATRCSAGSRKTIPYRANRCAARSRATMARRATRCWKNDACGLIVFAPLQLLERVRKLRSPMKIMVWTGNPRDLAGRRTRERRPVCRQRDRLAGPTRVVFRQCQLRAESSPRREAVRSVLAGHPEGRVLPSRRAARSSRRPTVGSCPGGTTGGAAEAPGLHGRPWPHLVAWRDRCGGSHSLIELPPSAAALPPRAASRCALLRPQWIHSLLLNPPSVRLVRPDSNLAAVSGLPRCTWRPARTLARRSHLADLPSYVCSFE
jgi:hypothetical protein